MNSPARDRAARPGDAGDQRERLRESVDDAVRDGEVLELTLLGADVVGDAEQHAEEDEHARRSARAMRNVVSIWSWNSSPSTHDRDAADDDQPAHPGVRVVARDPADQRLEPSPDDPHDVAPEEQDDRRLGADLRDGGERGAGVLRARQELAEDAQVRAGGDRQELGESLDQAEDDRLEEAWAPFVADGAR